MEPIHEGLAIERDYTRRESSPHTPAMPIRVDGGNTASIGDGSARRMIPKINRQQAAAIRLLKESLRAMLRTGGTLQEAREILGSAFPHWVQTKLPLTVAEADLLIRLATAESGIREKDLSPTQDVKLTRLVEVFQRLVGIWCTDAPMQSPRKTTATGSSGGPAAVMEG